MTEIAEECRPITGRGVGYKLFTKGLIPSMSAIKRKNPKTGKTENHVPMRNVYRLLLAAREEGLIPWHWIVDENRNLERVPSWDDPADFAYHVGRQYRRDFWNQQPIRVEIWSEKGTVRGVLEPILDHYGVGFRVMHGFGGATPVQFVAQDHDGRLLIVIYVGDFDPSGMCMSENDLPKRLEKYGGDHVLLNRVAVIKPDLMVLPTFPATDKLNDSRYPWFVRTYGDPDDLKRPVEERVSQCCELDAMDPNMLRDLVEEEIKLRIEPVAWARCETVNKAEQESLQSVLDIWKGAKATA